MQAATPTPLSLLTPLLLAWAGQAAAAATEPHDTHAPELQPMSASEAVAGLSLPEGFEANVFAAEPMLRQPIDVKIDRQGRVWVVENFTYSERATGWHPELRDRILVLEDSNGDGIADKRSVFWDQGQRLTSIELGHGGVWALAPPLLWFIPWAGDDLKPDGEPVVVLDGFVVGNVRHNIANGLMWGPDGWLYGRHGIMDTSSIGRPGTPPGQRLELNCGIWRVHPGDHRHEVVWRGGTNPWGMDYDQHGEWFLTNTVIGHLWHVIPGGHAERMYGRHRNPHLHRLLRQTADHFHFDTGKGWTETREGDPTTDRLGGGHAHVGCLIYQGDNWPQDMRHLLYTLNFHGRRVNVERLERQGAGFVGRHEPDLFQMQDPWFRGMELRTMADGSVLMSDWSDTGECHNHLAIHRNSGRLYRIAYGKPQRAGRALPRIDRLDDAQLVALLAHENSWQWRGALLTLQERGLAGELQDTTAGLLLNVLAEPQNPTPVRLRALWALATAVPLESPFLLALLDEADEALRVWALRLLLEERVVQELQPDAPARQRLLKLAREDDSGLVRLYLAAGVRRLHGPLAFQLAEALSKHDADAADPNLPLLLWHSIEPQIATDPDRALDLMLEARWPSLRQSVSRRLAADLDQNPEALGRIVQALLGLDDGEASTPILADALQGVAVGLGGRAVVPAPENWPTLVERWQATDPGDGRVESGIRDLAVYFGDGVALDSLRDLARDKQADPQARRQAVRSLAQARPDGLAEMLFELVNDPEVEVEALRALAGFEHPDTAELVIRRFGQLTPAGRQAALDTLSSRSVWARALLRALVAARIDTAELSAWHLRQLRLLQDEQVTVLLEAHWPALAPVDPDVEATKEKWRGQLDQTALTAADLPNGRQVFDLACAGCHQLYGEGRAFGPDLTGSGRGNLEYLLDHLVDPNALVSPQFEAARVELMDGRVLTGVVSEAGGDRLSVQTPAETLDVPRVEVVAVKPLGISLMPAGLLDGLSPQQVRDLIAYLMHPRQAARRAE